MNATKRRVKLICNDNIYNSNSILDKRPQYKFMRDIEVKRDPIGRHYNVLSYIRVMTVADYAGQEKAALDERLDRKTFAEKWFYYGFDSETFRKMKEEKE